MQSEKGRARRIITKKENSPFDKHVFLPDAILRGKVVGVFVIFAGAGAIAADQGSSVGRGHELSLDCGMAGVAEITDSGHGIEAFGGAVGQQGTLALRRDSLHGRNPVRGTTTESKVHLAGVNRVAAHTLKHSAAVGVLLEASGSGLVVQEIREQ
jgi:hypothetical protein